MTNVQFIIDAAETQPHLGQERCESLPLKLHHNRHLLLYMNPEKNIYHVNLDSL